MNKKTYGILLSSAALLFGLGAIPANQSNGQGAASSEQSEEENLKKLSEAFGHFVGKNLSTPGINFDLELVIKGIREGAAGKPSPMSDEDYQKLLNKYLTKAYTDLAEKNLNEANEFLATNKGKSGVKEIEEGKLQYEVLQEGNGKEVTSDSTPEIEYTGKFIDGKVFDESAKRGGPVSIPLKNTIQGFSKGIAGMKEGEKRRLYIHPDLGYGTAGQLPPNSLLIFDVEVVKADTGKETKEDTHTGNGKKPSNETSELDDDEDGLDDDDEDFQLPPW